MVPIIQLIGILPSQVVAKRGRDGHWLVVPTGLGYIASEPERALAVVCRLSELVTAARPTAWGKHAELACEYRSLAVFQRSSADQTR